MTLLTSEAFLRGILSPGACVFRVSFGVCVREKRSYHRAEHHGRDLSNDRAEGTGAGTGFDKHGNGCMIVNDELETCTDLALQRAAGHAERISSSVM